MRIHAILLIVAAVFLATPAESQAFGRRSRTACTVVPVCVCPAPLPSAACSPCLPSTNPADLKTGVSYNYRNDLTICGNQPIPAGYVMIGQTTVFSCGGTGNNNAMVLRKLLIPAGTQMTICGNQPIPAGRVLVGQTTVFACGGTGNSNAMVIRKL